MKNSISRQREPWIFISPLQGSTTTQLIFAKTSSRDKQRFQPVLSKPISLAPTKPHNQFLFLGDKWHRSAIAEQAQQKN